MQYGVHILVCNRTIDKNQSGELSGIHHPSELGEIIFESVLVVTYVADGVWIVGQFFPAAMKIRAGCRVDQSIHASCVLLV